MKLTKKKEAEIMQVYNTWWESYLTGDVNTYDSFLDDTYRFVGSTNGEEFLNKKDTTAFFKATADQLAGKAELRNVLRTVERLDEGLVLITDCADAWVISEKTWVFYSRFRFSSLLRETKNGWRFIYQHFSAPDTKAQEGETLGTEQVTKENQELRDAVKRRTVELEHKTKELEIEAALERVRTVAMGMKKPDDILEICKIMFTELQFLGFSNLRNTLINFWDDAHDSLIDYDYSDYAGGNKALLAYDSHPVFEQYQKKIKKSKDAFAKLVIKKDKLESWKQRRRESGEYEDPRLNNITALYYYFYSIGVGAIGISTFSAITVEKLDILQRFRNVFDFAYRRYADVAQAEAQAREAKIEASLERVRSRTMAMHKSEEVMDVAGTLFQELQKIGFAFGASSIIIMDNESGDAEYWIAGFSKEKFPESYQIKYFHHPYHDALLAAWKTGQKGLVYTLAGDEKIAYDEVLFTQTGYKNIPAEDQKLMRGSESVTFSIAFMKHGALHWGPSSLNEEQADVLQRFAKVFEQSYTRFLDLEKAEAQAREAQIEAALERVRAKVMAMTNSKELNATSLVFGEHLRKLNIDWQFSYFWLVDEAKDKNTFWITWPDHKTSLTTYTLKEAEESFNDCLMSWRNGIKIHDNYVPPEDVQEWLDTYQRITDDAGGVASEIMVAQTFPTGVYYYDAMMKYGSFGICINKPASGEEKNIQCRFAIEFERAYARFIDLQKAEAQAREAQIELGLERVRARAMSMQRSDELSELVDTVFKELTKLDFAISMCIINIIDESTLSNMVWGANPDTGKPPDSYYMKFEDYPFHHAMMKGYKERNTKFIYVIEGEEKTVYDEYLFNETEFRKMPKEAQAASKALEKYVSSFTFSNFGGLQTVGDSPLSEANLDILSRFGKVFDLTYTRFNDLKQAEAQVREAQIEASLEKVRAHTMGMHASKDLSNVASVMFNQMKNLGGELFSFAIVLCDKQKNIVEQWHNIGNEGMLPPFFVPIDLDYIHQYRYDQWKAGVELFSIEIPKDYIRRHFELMFELDSVDAAMAEATSQGVRVEVPEWEIDYGASFRHGYLLISSLRPFKEDHIFPRFAKVFDQAYTRFLDLQKAEAQAREAHIEAALEKVRSRTMAMQKSDELLDVASVMFQQVKGLGIPQWNCGFNIWNTGDKEFTYYPGSPDGIISPSPCKIPLTEHPVFRQFDESRKRGDELLVYEKAGEVQADHYRYMLSLRGVGDLLQSMLEAGFELPAFQVDHVANFAYGNLIFITYEHFPEMHDVFRRFAKVFEQTYTRFLDLQKAEAQAREAQIEAALERVRSRTMAMQKSSELAETSFVLFQQFQALGETSKQISIGIFKEVENIMELYSTLYGSQWREPVNLDLDEPVVVRKIYGAWKEQKKSMVIDLSGEDLINYNAYRKKLSNIDYIEDRWVIHIAFFSQGVLTFSVTEPHPDNTVQLLERFAQVFDLTYTRFNDLKKAEAQAREGLIELALERVRARTMAMQKSGELADAAQLLYREFGHLNINTFVCGYMFIDEARQTQTGWFVLPDGSFLPDFIVFPLTGDHVLNSRYQDWKEKKPLHIFEIEGEANKEHHRFLSKHVPPFVEDDIFSKMPARVIFNCANFSNGYLLILSTDFFSEEERQTIVRFAKVFEQTYTRFLDLQKAEAQAREARIETSLERLRSKTMAMHNSKDVGETVAVMFDELIKLGIDKTIRCGIAILDESKHMEVWRASVNAEGETGITIGVLDMTIHPLLMQLHDVWSKKESSHTYELTGENLISYYKALNSSPGYPAQFDIASLPAKEINSAFLFPEGALFTFSQEPLSPSTAQILKRFSGVFAQTYRRYLDLQKAEAQAKEAQIEAALERTRTHTMLMQHSIELDITSRVFHEQLLLLGIESEFSYVWLPDVEKDKHLFWATWNEEKNGTKVLQSKSATYDLDRTEPYTAECFRAWASSEPVHVYRVAPLEVKNYFEIWQGIMGDAQKQKPEFYPEGLYYIEAFMRYGCFGINIRRLLTEDEKKILFRFSIEFERTYTRFLDLQKAEAQTREAKIEAAMEKVRSRAMAMQKPDELIEVAQLLRREMNVLGVEELETSSIYIHHEDTGQTECWYAIKDIAHPERNLVSDHMSIDLNETWVGRQMLGFYHSDNKRTSLQMQGDVRKEWINYCADHSKVLSGFYGNTIPDRTYHLYKFSNGYIGAASAGEISAESWDLLQRATSVFSLAYTRFSDLQQAEAQTREAQIETALERVRSRTLAMQRSNELAETAAVLFKQLINLGIAPNRLYIGIIKDDLGHIEFWVTDEDGSKVSTQFIANIHRNDSIKKMYIAWKEEGKSLTIDMHGKELEKYFHYLSEELHVPFKHGLSQKRRIQTVAFFAKGFIGIASPDEQPEETTFLLERFASVFNLTYTRFNDLKVAEAHALQAEEDLSKLQAEKKRAEEALDELQSAQRQLIQSEKMASLGELTAGIAHEIQNPLNFVNNFSEVNKELLAEMKEEIDNSNFEAAKQIAESIIQNEEKIISHGKRADVIVKGMLQHSRSSSGQKELTDINVLADEYLRLAYHGLRAKDKSFTATFETDFDESIAPLYIVPQDIGRVILNLITNAFYAVNERKKTEGPLTPQRGIGSLSIAGYEPIVVVTTRRLILPSGSWGAEITVRDNGNGIPKHVVDKIFQPFFTTKPTGQGTGLGLSLSYDIVKAHGGELKVETLSAEAVTHVGEGTVGTSFIIQLPAKEI